jgi:hypothetical protein
MQELIGIMRDECAKVGRDADSIELTGGLMSPDHDVIARYRDMGFSRMLMPPPGYDKDAISKGLDAFASKFLR